MPGHAHDTSSGDRRANKLPPVTPMVSLRQLTEATSKINALSQQVQDLAARDRERQMHQTSKAGLNSSAAALFSTMGDMAVSNDNLLLNPVSVGFSGLASHAPFNVGMQDLSRYVDGSAGISGGWSNNDAYRRCHLAQLGGTSAMSGPNFNNALNPWPASSHFPTQFTFDLDSRYDPHSSFDRRRWENRKQPEIVVVTTDHVPGFRIVEARGRLLAALNQREIKQIREWVERTAPLEATRTGQVAKYVRQHVHNQVIMQAMQHGCNAIVDFQFDSELHTDSSGNTACTGLSARGLAVVVKATISDKERKREKRKTIEDLRKIQKRQEEKEYHRRLRRELNALDPKERKERIKELQAKSKAQRKKEPTHKSLMAQLMALLDDKDKMSGKSVNSKGKAKGVRFADDDRARVTSDEDLSSSENSCSDDEPKKGRQAYGVESDTDLDAVIDRLMGKSGSARGSAGWDATKSRSRKDSSGGSRSSKGRRGFRTKDRDFISSLFSEASKGKKKGYYFSSDSDSSSSSSSSSEDFPSPANTSRSGNFKWST